MDSAWLRAEAEPALLPEIDIIDPHHHFWGEGPLADRFGRFLPEDFTAEIDRNGHRIVATVYLECLWSYRTEGPEHLRCVGETERVEAVANEYAKRGGPHADLAAAIIGKADLLLGDGVDAVLEAHMLASPSRFRGIRDVTAADPDEPLLGNSLRGRMSDPRFRAGLARLEQFELSFDTWCVHTQLGEFADLAGAFPGVRMILNHLGSPLGVGRFKDRQAEVFEDWKKAIDGIAHHPNVFVKIGGLGMPGAGFDWAAASPPPGSQTLAEAYRPFVVHAIEKFSPERCMFESNFAVDGLSYGYGAIWNAFKRLVSDSSADEQKALFRDTAARVYRIPLQSAD